MLSSSILSSLDAQTAALFAKHHQHWTDKKVKRIMADLYPDEDLLLESVDWDCDGCAPPVFNVPPPPRPPWLEDLDGCEQNGGHSKRLDDILSQMETCDNTIIRDSRSYFDDTFHSIAVIVVSAIVLVIVLLVVAFMLFKRRKRCYHQRESCHPSHPLVNEHQFRQKDLSPGQMSTETMHGGPDTNNSSLLNSLAKSRPVLPLVTALTKSGQTVTSRCCGNLEAHFQRHYHSSFSNSDTATTTNSLPNHYIPDVGKSQTVVRLQGHDEDSLRSRFLMMMAERKRTVMELSERPPQQSANVCRQPTYPHIVIGGKPFYLIPTSADQVVVELENYAYPQQQMPIYEEIDATYSSAQMYDANGDLDCSSEQGEVGSVDRFGFRSAPKTLNNYPMAHRSPLHRPLSSQSASHNSSSQQTNTSEVSASSSSSTASSSHSNANLDIPAAHYVLLDPEEDSRGCRRPPVYENTLARAGCSSPKTQQRRHSKLSSARLADGVERSLSPQSIYAARLAHKTSPNRSVYYYSDTLKKDPDLHKLEQPSHHQSSCEPPSSGSQEDTKASSSSAVAVHTKVVLQDPKSVDHKSGSTLV